MLRLRSAVCLDVCWGVNLLISDFSSSTHFAGPHAPAPMGGAARGRLRYGIVKPPLALGGRRVGHRPPQGSVPSWLPSTSLPTYAVRGLDPKQELTIDKTYAIRKTTLLLSPRSRARATAIREQPKTGHKTSKQAGYTECIDNCTGSHKQLLIASAMLQR